jgi:hypothetical protein
VKNPTCSPDAEIPDTQTIVVQMLQSQEKIRELLAQFQG